MRPQADVTFCIPTTRRPSTEAAGVTLLCGVVAFCQIILRGIDGHEQFPAFLAKERSQAA
jgi:hypothetical protein